MQRFILAGVLLQLAATPVIAQTSAFGPSTDDPSTLSSPTTPPTVMAQNQSVPTMSSSTASAPPVATADGVPGGVPGANSFTEGQARSRLEDSGFTNVSGLTKDTDGVWRGTAVRDATQVAVGVDFKGNIVTQ
jgi:hypothetical protein